MMYLMYLSHLTPRPTHPHPHTHIHSSQTYMKVHTATLAHTQVHNAIKVNQLISNNLTLSSSQPYWAYQNQIQINN